MSAPRKFDEETRARAVRLYTDHPRGGATSAVRRSVPVSAACAPW